MIELDSVTKRFSSVVAVDDLTLKLKAGTLFGFLGPNGAGKTTTIKMLVGIMKPTRGRIEVLGMDISKRSQEVKRCLGYIPDRPYLYEKLTGAEFISLTLRLYGIREEVSLKERIDYYLELFSLAEWKDELIENYSHGMKQRLIVTSVLIRDPKIIIVDEPMVGLDPIAVRMVKDIFRDLVKKGKTIFMSTHSVYLAEEICSEIGLIHKGRLVLKDKTEEIMKSFKEMKSLEDIFIKLTLG